MAVSQPELRNPQRTITRAYTHNDTGVTLVQMYKE
jgi:hypothetical protein